MEWNYSEPERRMNEKMEFYQYILEPINSNMFVLIENNRAIVIDPSIQEDALTVLSPMQSVQSEPLEPISIILTHEHYDHISGVNWLKQHFSCEVLCSSECAAAIEKPERNLSKYYNILFQDKDEEVKRQVQQQNVQPYSCRADRILKDGESLMWQGHILQFTYTPGHSKGSACINLDGNYLFSGDSIVNGRKTFTRVPGGSRTDFMNITLPFLKNQPPDITICPGHGALKRLREYDFKEIY